MRKNYIEKTSDGRKIDAYGVPEGGVGKTTATYIEPDGTERFRYNRETKEHFMSDVNTTAGVAEVTPETEIKKTTLVEPTKTPFESKLEQKDLTIGEKIVLDGFSLIIGSLVRLAQERKYGNRLITRMENTDKGNPLIPYIKSVAFFAENIKQQVDADPEFQAGLEAAERKQFMERMSGGMIS